MSGLLYDQHISNSFLYLSKYYYHKNHKILIDVAQLIKEQKLNYVIYITISSLTADEKKFMQMVRNLGLGKIIVNLGPIPFDEINSVYFSVHAAIIPSFLESFGLTYLEALKNEKPVLAANLDFAKETLKDSAFYFDPFDSESILYAMNLSLNKEENQKKMVVGKLIVENWPTWDDIGLKYYKLIKTSSKSALE